MIYLQHNLWTQLKTRRLQCWGGSPNIEDNLENTLPSWLNEICNAFVQNGFFPPDFPPNHVLINEYQPGQGIMHHTDGPRYLDKVIIISLGSSTVMNFLPRLSSDEIGIINSVDDGNGNMNDKEVSTQINPPSLNLILNPRSVLFFSEEIYHNYLHGIEAQTYDDYDALDNLLNPPTSQISSELNEGKSSNIHDREKRISLTIRHQYRSSSSSS